jgi:Tfp pilus assembly protein PilO
MTLLLQQLLAVARRHPYVAVNLLLVVLLSGANYALWSRRETATLRHETARRTGEEMLHALTNYGSITSDLAAVNSALGQIDRNLVVERDLEVNLGYFYQMETLSRVRLRQLNQLAALPPAEDNPFKVVPFSAQAAGNFSQLINFLRELETGPRTMRVDSYSLSRGDPKTNALVLDLTVQCLARP